MVVVHELFVLIVVIKILTRDQLQELIAKENPVWTAKSDTINPDADVYLTEDQLGDFKVNENQVLDYADRNFLAPSMSSMLRPS